MAHPRTKVMKYCPLCGEIVPSTDWIRIPYHTWYCNLASQRNDGLDANPSPVHAECARRQKEIIDEAHGL